MIESRLTHIVILTMDCILLGIIIDRLSANPIWALVIPLILFGVIVLTARKRTAVENRLDLDAKASGILRSVALAIIFFILSAIAARLII